jgi:PKD repeat protein
LAFPSINTFLQHEELFMKHVRFWSLLAAFSASTGFLLGDTWQALITDESTNQIFPFNLGPGQSPTPETIVTGITGPTTSVITPDATKALVAGDSGYPLPNAFTLDLETSPISVSGPTASATEGFWFSAISPDGAKVYAQGRSGGAGDIRVYQTSDLVLLTTIHDTIFAPYHASFLALSPNKPEAYVATIDTKLFVVNTDTNSITTSFDTPFNTLWPAVTPDGSEVYISYSDSPNVSYVTLSDRIVHDVTGLPTASQTAIILISPDGSALYAIQLVSGQWYVTKVDTKTHAFVTQYPIPSEIQNPYFFSITPDGKTLCIPDSGSQNPGHVVAFMDLTTGSSITFDLSSDQNSHLFWPSISPDQAPTARFTPTMSGATVTFDASASSSPVGSIATYAWDFGDGQTETTASPTISHTYTTSGTFTTTLKVTNTGGTSTDITYTGRMTSNNGGPSAVTTQQITVQTIGVAKFKGKVHRDHKHKRVSLKTKWTKSLIPNTRKYEIFAGNMKIATVKTNHKRHKTLQLHPHHFPNKISKGYRTYLDHKYNIRVVDTLGHISQPTFVHVVKH